MPLAVLVLLAAALPAWADAVPPQLALTGRVQHPRSLTMAELRALPPVSVTVDQETGHGRQHASYTGPLLWTLVTQAIPVDEPGTRMFIRHTLLATGQDGYAVALAIGELDPMFEGKQVVVATSLDGKALLVARLVVPGDSHAGRAVRDLVSVEVR